MRKEEVLKKYKVLDKMFSKCGDGVNVMCMSDDNDSIDRFRIYRHGGRVNWVKCKEILRKNNINDFTEGHDGYGMWLGRCIDFDF
jgi:hypothetical protein